MYTLMFWKNTIFSRDCHKLFLADSLSL